MNDATPIKFSHPDITAKGETRASVSFRRLETLWINTGTLCNIECANCYIHSSPTDDRLVYFTAADAARLFVEAAAIAAESGQSLPEIGFTGGEPFMNPNMLAMTEDALVRGHEVLILTNAMQPMMRPKVKQGLISLRERFGEALKLRVSIDHHTEALHDAERGKGSFAKAIEGLRWLAANGFSLAIAGRTIFGETEVDERAGYAAFLAREGIALDADDPSALLLFPEMDERAEVPEITTACWDILHKNPADMMCATGRMAVKRKGAAAPVLVACTLLPDDPRFEMGQTIRESLSPVKLNHPHCAKFCVLGGASCSV